VFKLQDLADVYFNKVVPDEIMHKMSGNVGNLPQGLSIIQPKSSKEPNFINYCRSKVYPRIHAIRQSFLVTEENNAFKKMTIVGYSVVIQTGSMRGAGTDNDVGLVIFGTSGKTSKIKLDNFWQNDFENAQTDEFNIKAYDVGQIEYIAIALKPSLPFQDSWYINTITIRKSFCIEGCMRSKNCSQIAVKLLSCKLLSRRGGEGKKSIYGLRPLAQAKIPQI
jgi:hypothetical protein